MRFRTLCTLGVTAISAAWAGQARAGLIVGYNFDTINGSFQTPNGGSDTTSGLMLGGNGTAADRRSADGTGVSGLPGDRAFDNSVASAHGSSATSGTTDKGRVYQTADNAATDALRSFTLSGWFKAATAPQSSARVAHNSDQVGGFDLIFTSAGTLRLGVDENPTGSGAGVASRTGAYSLTDQWVFFAVTYDGSAASQQVHFYMGTPDQEVVDVSDTVTATDLGLTYAKGDVGDENVPLSFFNQNVGTGTTYRPVDGLLDDMRLYGSATDASGALSLDDLKAVRGSAVPEPATAGVVAAGAVGLLARRRRR